MKLRWHPKGADHDDADRSNDDGGGQGAEYVEPVHSTMDDNEADRDSWRRARHWTSDQP